MTSATDLCWPASRAVEGLELLAHVAGLPVRSPQSQYASNVALDSSEQLVHDAMAIGLEAEPIDTSCAEVDLWLRAAGPAVVRLNDDALVMLVGRRGRRLRVVRPDHRVATVTLELLRAALIDQEAAPLVAETQRLADEAGVVHSRRGKVVRALVADRLRSRRVRAGWLIRLPPNAGFRARLVAAGARRQLIMVAAAHAGQYALWIVAWALLGRAALQGHLDTAWLIAWALALFTLLPLQLSALWLQGRLAIGAGALLKQRLLAGAFRLESEETRREGAGQLLGRVIESEAIESLALSGGLMAMLAAIELVLAAVVLALSTPFLSMLLLAWTGLTAALAAVYFGRRLDWVRLRVDMTHGLIERMLGHRTRLAQQPREHWHDGEDETLERYVRASATMDRAAVWLLGLVPRGWMVAGVCALAPLFVGGGSATSLAIGLGGILLAFRAFERLTGGLWSLMGALIAWRQVSPVFRAAARTAPERPASSPAGLRRPAVLSATDVRFTHAGRDEPVLRGSSLAIAGGDHAILQGASGSGKSTLAAILAGLRTPQSGLLLLDGLDHHTLGLERWRRRVVLVPQFHENHLLLGSVAFNVLMGGEWPPAPEDFGRAEKVLRELGLGGTLDRMPSGILQTIGETGWQLSHGERSRIFLARALLQRPDVLILDESFAQLDPANIQLALDAVVASAAAVLLIAHQ